jgi:7-carboxy-7-deazaguanine synthase
MSRDLRISECFGLVVQGEGPLIGLPTVFVRAGGCDYRCSWCDTLYAVLPEHRAEWVKMNAPEVLGDIQRISGPCLVTLSGGNPASQPFGELIDIGHAAGYRFACETQGSVAAPWFGRLDHLILSPKPPSSGMDTDWKILAECMDSAGWGRVPTSIKVVVFDDADYEYAHEVQRQFPSTPFYLQVGNPTPQAANGSDPGFDAAASLAALRVLMDRVCADKWLNVRVLPQLHTLVFGNARSV